MGDRCAKSLWLYRHAGERRVEYLFIFSCWSFSNPHRAPPPLPAHHETLGLLLRRNGEFDTSCNQLENSPSVCWKRTTQHPGGCFCSPLGTPTGCVPREDNHRNSTHTEHRWPGKDHPGCSRQSNLSSG